MLRPLFLLFEQVAQGVDSITTAIKNKWRWLVEGPLQFFFFYLILTVAGTIIIIKATCEEVDRLLAKIEKALISIALLAMVGLSFMTYLRREFSLQGLDIVGGTQMAAVLLVWVGFLGASLASRQKKHLAVDATDRILSPAAAKLTKRFTALLAAIFCWKFFQYSLKVIDESLVQEKGQESLPLWKSLEPGVEWLGSFLHTNSQMPLRIAISSGIVLLFCVYLIRVYRCSSQHKALKFTLEIVGSFCVFIGGLAMISHLWNPVTETGETYVWPERVSEAELLQSAEASTVAELNDLVGDDTGEEDNTDAAPSTQTDLDDLGDFIDKSSGGREFPKWLTKAGIPLSFLLMSFRFFAIFISGRVEKPEAEDDNLDEDSIKTPPPPQKWVRSTGRGGRDLLFTGLLPGILIGIGVVFGLSTGWLILLTCITLLLVGSPLFLVIGIGTLGCVTLLEQASTDNIINNMYYAVKKQELLAIPFFVLAGNLMTKGAIATRLVNVARAFMGRTPGGLGLSAVFACVIFAAISGSSPVTVIAVGSIMFPVLIRERYPEGYSSGVLTSAGSLGIIIPPSVPMIIYAIMVGEILRTNGQKLIGEDGLLPGGYDPKYLNVKPDDLFIAGVLPGLFIAGMLALYTMYHLRPTRKDLDLVVPEIKDGYWLNLFRELKSSWLAMLLPVLILGGIYGILGPIKFTVTEAAAVAVVYALIVELVFHRELSPKDLPKVLSDSGVMMGGLFLIIVLAIAFNKYIAAEQIPQQATDLIQGLVDNKWQFLIIVNIFLLILGCIMDIISAILIVAPLLAPIAISYGIHPLHFGIMFIVNLELGYLTPPLGINLFVASTVFKRSIVDIMKGVLPFLFLMLFCLIVIILFPWLSLALVG